MLFDTKKEFILENNRVLLRPLTEADSYYLLPFSEKEPELWTYSVTPGDSKEKLTAYLMTALENKNSGDSYPFIVFDKKTKQYAGTTRFYDIQRHHKTVQLGYTWYGSDFQGTGLNKHCKFLLLQFAFETLKLERVEFRADANNARSIAAMKSIGCTVEGILRNNYTIATGRRDSIVLSILKDEWVTSVKKLITAKLEKYA